MSGAKNKRAEKARRKRVYALRRARALLVEARKVAVLDPSHENLTRVHTIEAAVALLESIHAEEETSSVRDAAGRRRDVTGAP